MSHIVKPASELADGDVIAKMGYAPGRNAAISDVRVGEGHTHFTLNGGPGVAQNNTPITVLVGE